MGHPHILLASKPLCTDRSFLSRPLCEAAPNHGLTEPDRPSPASRGCEVVSCWPPKQAGEPALCSLAPDCQDRMEEWEPVLESGGSGWGSGFAPLQLCDLSFGSLICKVGLLPRLPPGAVACFHSAPLVQNLAHSLTVRTAAVSILITSANEPSILARSWARTLGSGSGPAYSHQSSPQTPSITDCGFRAPIFLPHQDPSGGDDGIILPPTILG